MTSRPSTGSSPRPSPRRVRPDPTGPGAAVRSGRSPSGQHLQLLERLLHDLHQVAFLVLISDLRSGANHDVALTAPTGACVRDIDPLLTQFVDRPSEWRMNGRRLLPADLLTDVGFSDGAILQAAPAVPVDAPSEGLLPEIEPDEIVGHLRVVGGPDAGTTWTLGSGSYVIGRSKGADLRLPSDGEVSRQHVRLRLDAEGAVIEDLVSSNGTLVGGIELKTPTRLSAGEIVEIGDSMLTLTLASGPTAMVDVERERDT